MRGRDVRVHDVLFGLIAAFVMVVAQTKVVRADPTIIIESRGLHIPAILLTPAGKAKGGVILMAGGSGRLDISGGDVHALRFNQLVRTRALYQKAGYLTLVPDIAPDMKVGDAGVTESYRGSAEHAQDIGVMVTYLRQHGAAKVWVVGTSRGTLSAANAVSRLAGQPQRPDAAVLTSGFWALGEQARGPSIWKIAEQGRAQNLAVSTLLVRHLQDACEFSNPANVPAFAEWLKGGGAEVAIRDLSGGLPPESDPCEARAAHGFYGLDPQVVQEITNWMGQGL
jgi:pimeloyl-ACP methyl ester carboxylesterase